MKEAEADNILSGAVLSDLKTELFPAAHPVPLTPW